jgi:hypothetical protein
MEDEGKFLTIALVKSALMIKKMGRDRDHFTQLCGELWDSIELEGEDYMNSLINAQIRNDIQSHMEKYRKYRETE